jgi:hypothetical protein
MTKAKPKEGATLFAEKVEEVRERHDALSAARKARGDNPKNAVVPSPPVPPDPFLAMIREVAMNPSLDVSKLDALLQMQERVMDRNAKKDFDAAMSRMQAELPVIERRGLIEVRAKDSRGERTGAVQQSSPYARWEDVVEKITPVLSRHGFSLQFKTGLTEKGLVRVDGFLAGHGHRETAYMELQHDSTGSKNAAQAVASSVSYGKRMVGCAMLNVVSRGEDDDGNGTGKPLVQGEPLSAEQRTQILELATAVECPGPHLLKHLNSKRPAGHPEVKEIDDLPGSRFEEAIEALRSYEQNKKDREAKHAYPVNAHKR